MTNSGAYRIEDFLEVRSAFGGTFNSDETKIAYVSNVSGTLQLYLISREGGESLQLTDFEDSIAQFSYSPIEEKIVFSKSKGGNENAQLYLLDVVTKAVTPLTNKENVRYNLAGYSRDGKYISYASNERNGKDFDVYIMDAQTRVPTCIAALGGMCSPAGISPKSTYITVVQIHSNENNDVYLYSLSDLSRKHLTPHEGKVSYSAPRWLPDESAFFMTTDENTEFDKLLRYSMQEAKFETLMDSDWGIAGFGVSEDGTYLTVVKNEDGYHKVSLYDPVRFTPIQNNVPKGEIYGGHFSSDSRYFLFSLGDAKHTVDVWISDMQSGKIRQLTHSSQGVPPEVLVEPELFRFKSFDGLEIPAFIYKPKNISAGAKLPVVINIHGGPESQYTYGLALISQYFIHAGYIVVAPNVRGSSGYGKTYMALDNVEKRMDSVKDIVALHDHLITLPEVDPSKIVVMGGSYGGFMVLACMAFYPDFWAAGIDTVGIANFITFLENTAPYRRHLREAEYGSLEKDRKFLESISPINAVENIKAPLFIIHGANDPRVPLSEAEQMHGKLKALGRNVELLVYPDEGHGLSKLKNRLDAYPKMADFLEKVLR